MLRLQGPAESAKGGEPHMEPDRKEEEQVPFGQIVFDELFLFFMLSLVISFVVYNVWGLMDLLSTPLLVP
jgi:hypothetical protein